MACIDSVDVGTGRRKGQIQVRKEIILFLIYVEHFFSSNNNDKFMNYNIISVTPSPRSGRCVQLQQSNHTIHPSIDWSGLPATWTLINQNQMNKLISLSDQGLGQIPGSDTVQTWQIEWSWWLIGLLAYFKLGNCQIQIIKIIWIWIWQFPSFHFSQNRNQSCWGYGYAQKGVWMMIDTHTIQKKLRSNGTSSV